MNSMLIQFARATVCPIMDGRHIIKSEFKEGCFIYQSFGSEESSFGDMLITPHVSFLADSGEGMAAEWEPQYGPIQLWTECAEDWRGQAEHGNEIKPRAHWHFAFVEDKPADWSQLAVDREDLKGMLSRGNLEGVFNALMCWASH